MKLPLARIENFVVPAKADGNALMKAVWLDVEGERLVATNGHMGVRVSIGVDSDDTTGLLPIEVFELARKELKAIQRAVKEAIPDPWLKISAGPDAVIVQNLLTSTSHMVLRPKLTGKDKFPDVDAVFPKITAKPAVSLSVEYLDSIAKSLQPEGVAMSLWVEGRDKAVVIANLGGDALVALMPMRGEPDPSVINKRGRAKNTEKGSRDEKLGDETP